MKITIEGNARELAELISAIQEQPELQALRRKPFNTLTTDDFARMASAHGDATTIVSVCTDKDLRD